MPADRPDVDAARFAPHAARPMAEMFDDVSGRYDLLNRLLSLGRDGAWRRTMWAAIPEEARAVLDLCTGSGVSLPGLRRPGRLVIGADLSLRMLELAAEVERRTGWAPRLLCADGFHLPLRDGSIDAVTIAFGMRNLRPRPEALAELGRVLAPGGRLAVLEATAPRPGPLASFHRFYLERVVPAAGRLSPDPSAYRYLGRSILEFGDGRTFEQELGAAGFRIEGRRRFLLGATRLWVARREAAGGQNASISPTGLQTARRAPGARAAVEGLAGEWRIWTGVQAAISASLFVVLVVAGWTFAKWGAGLPLAAWQRPVAWTLIVGGAVAFGFRTMALVARWMGGAPRA
jgi:demethylmenaquinone methyltransferase / 2-methoxy-6-polyprenyl-1,4-benzoquinol methylase